MQILLTQEEYDALQAKISSVAHLPESKKFDKLCSKIADEMPVEIPWLRSKPKAPVGCIHTTQKDGYCDYCPAKEICQQGKHFSQ